MRIVTFLGHPLRTAAGRIGVAAAIGGLAVGLLLGMWLGGGSSTPPGASGDPAPTVGDLGAPPDPADPADPAAVGGPDRNPLTGRAPADGTPRRIIAAKVDNVGAALPQVGLEQAEMIIEVPVEGGSTRFIALFHDHRTGAVGPIRSVRPVDADLLAPLRPALLATGGRDFVTALFDAATITILDLDASGAYTVIDRPEPHQYVALLEGADSLVGDTGSETGMFAFGEGFDADRSVGTLTIPFSAVAEVTWRHDGERWVRSQNDEPSLVLDDIGGVASPLTTDTVVILSAAQRSAGYTDSAGADVPTFDVIGFGDAVVAHDGGLVAGRWLRAAQEDPWLLVDGDGAPLTLPPGRVFLEIVPRTVAVILD